MAKPKEIQEEIEYGKYVIVTEPHGRVMVTRDGLHITEFMDIDADINDLIKQSKEYIDGSIR